MILKTLLLSAVLLFNVNNTQDNTLDHSTNIDNTQSTYDCDTDTTEPVVINNAEVGIFPGASNDGKTFVPKGKISPDVLRDFIVTGIQASENGKEIVIYATHGKITLLPNHTGSSSNNRIEQSSNMVIHQGEFAELTYNANSGKWVITSIQ